MPTKTDTTTAKKTPKASAAQKEQARKARAGARIANESKAKQSTTKAKTTAAPSSQGSSNITTAHRSDLAGYGGVDFRAADYMTGDIWKPDDRIPAIDEGTYESWKTQAEGQGRSIEVASMNLKNIAGLHKLEGQTVDIAIAAKSNETRYAKLEGAEIGYQTQLQANGEATQRLIQATAKHEFATRETGYTNELLGMKDSNFQLEIQQARARFQELSARFSAQLSGQ